jgi:hypothetical protein
LVNHTMLKRTSHLFQIFVFVFLLSWLWEGTKDPGNPLGTDDSNPPVNLDPFERNERLGRGSILVMLWKHHMREPGVLR